MAEDREDTGELIFSIPFTVCSCAAPAVFLIKNDQTETLKLQSN